MLSRSLVFAMAVLLMNTAASDDKGQTYVDPNARFAVDIPTGWSIEAVNSSLGELQLSHSTGGGLALYFEESKPGKWTIDSLLKVIETAIRQEVAVGELRKSHDLMAGENLGRLLFFKSPQLGGELVVGCVILEKGGVVIQGIVSDPAPEKALLELIESVRETTDSE